jgi:TPR repeat protein
MELSESDNETILELTRYLTDLKKIDASYYETHKRINKILQRGYISPNTLIQFKSYEDRTEYNIVLAKNCYYTSGMNINILGYYGCLKDSKKPHALYLLGKYHLENKDERKAEEFFEKAAGPIRTNDIPCFDEDWPKENGGDMYAQYMMGRIMENKRDVWKGSGEMKTDEGMKCQRYAEQAKQYYMLSAYQGYDKAQYSLAIHTHSRVEWLKKSAIQGNKMALKRLKEEIYWAHEDYREAKLQNPRCEANKDLLMISIQHYVTKLKKDTFNIDNAEKLSDVYKACRYYNWFNPDFSKTIIDIFMKVVKPYQEHAEKDDPISLYILARLYQGIRDFTEDKDMLQRSAHLGCHQAQYLVGHQTSRGEDTGIPLLKLSASQGNYNAIFELAEKDCGFRKYWCFDNQDLKKAKVRFIQCRDNTTDKTMKRKATKRVCEIDLLIMKQRSEDEISKISNIHQSLCYCVQLNCDYKIPELLSKSPKCLQNMCKRIYKEKRLDKIDSNMLSSLYRKIKISIENKKLFPISSKDNGLRPFVKAFDGCIKDRVLYMREELNKTPLFVVSLHDIIGSYMDKYYL